MKPQPDIFTAMQSRARRQNRMCCATRARNLCLAILLGAVLGYLIAAVQTTAAAYPDFLAEAHQRAKG
jgi:hypothetical protein